jgi:type VI secretion system VasD/TssJ family lipoprotein
MLCIWGMTSACSSAKTTPPLAQAPSLHVDWAYEKDAIRLVFKADRNLNFHKGVPHALSLCISQLKDPNAFNQLSSDASGIYVLLGCETFDPGVTSLRRITVQPGQDLSVSLDRAQGTRYVGLAAGYYTMERGRIVRLMEIPVEVKSTGLVFRERYAVAAPLSVEVVLGSEQIEKVEALR